MRSAVSRYPMDIVVHGPYAAIQMTEAFHDRFCELLWLQLGTDKRYSLERISGLIFT